MQNAQKRMEHSELSLSSQTCSKPTRKISSSEAAETASFMALSSSSSAVRSPEIARRISGPMSWSVRRPACKTANYRASYLRVGTGEITALPFLPKHCGALLLSIAPPAPRTPTKFCSFISTLEKEKLLAIQTKECLLLVLGFITRGHRCKSRLD